MAQTLTNITIHKPLLTCPACENEIEGEAVISFDGNQPVLGGTHKTINLNGQVVGIKLQHDCTPKATQRRGRPPGTKNKPKRVSEVALQDEKSKAEERNKAEAHRDRLREHEATQVDG